MTLRVVFSCFLFRRANLDVTLTNTHDEQELVLLHICVCVYHVAMVDDVPKILTWSPS